MKRGLIVIGLFCLIFISLIGVVSAQDVNLALNGTPEYKILGYSRVGNIGSPTISELNINDNNDNSYIGFAGGTGTHQYFCGITEEIIHLRELSEIRNISYISWGCCGGGKSCTEYCYQEKYQGSGSYNIYQNLEETYVYNGTWYLVYSNKTVGKKSEKVTQGPWSNISKIKVYSALCQKLWDGYVNYKFYEIRAFGYETPLPICTPTTCSALGYNCGLWSNGTCGGVLNCGTCNAGESCPNGACLISKPCSSPNDTIMKLYQSNNSHGALWNDADYNYDICYSDIFGSDYIGDSHTCTGGAVPDNKVLGLFQENNSHAEIPSLDNYNVDVCYGNLECMSVTDPALCPVDYQTVVRLFQDTNSHISNASDTNYPIKICCKSEAVAPPPIEVYWADMNGNLITQAEIGDTVLMIYNKSSGNYNYAIQEDDFGEGPGPLDDKIRTISDSFSFQGKIAAKWTITQGDFDLGHPASDLGFEFITNNHEEFYFNVDGITSADLIVNKDSYNNVKPSTRIINPVNGANYTIDGSSTGNINFEQISSDEDDDLKILWSFGDGTNSIWLENCLTTGDCDTIHSYSNSGYKVIKLTAKEIGRSVPQTAVDYSGVYVYKRGTNVFAVITKPEFGKPVSGRFIQIDAHNSFAAECDSICPSSCSGSCYTLIDNLGVNPNLECCNYIKDNKLLFNWTFDDGTSKYGNWQDNYSEVVNFTKFFAEAGEHEIKLKVGYNKA